MVKCKDKTCKNAVININTFTRKIESYCSLQHIKQDDHCYKISEKYHEKKGRTITDEKI